MAQFLVKYPDPDRASALDHLRKVLASLPGYSNPS
jgi:hypothetical protein